MKRPSKKRKRNNEHAHGTVVVVPASSTFLPAEVLELIFRMLSPPSDPHETVYRCMPIIAVSHVCYRWRAITLSCSTLWTHVVPLLLGYKWTAEILARSKGAPLTLDIQNKSPRRAAINNASLKLVLKQLRLLDQTRTLIVSGSFQCGLEHTSASPAPRLESISFNNPTGVDDPYLHLPAMPYHHLVKFETPALRKLVLGSYLTLNGTNATIIKDLTYLDIRTTDMERISKTTDVLQALLSLESLALNIRETSIAVSFTIITLTSLTSIRLEGTASDCSKLLQQIRAPSIKAFSLVCKSRTKTELPDLLAAVSALCAQNKEIIALHQRPHQLFINMEKRRSRSMVIRMAETEYSRGIEAFCQPNSANWYPNWHMEFNYTVIPEQAPITPNEVASVFRALCLDSVTDAILQRLSGSGVSSLCKELIRRMPALRSLTVCHVYASAIIKAIQPNKSFPLGDLSELYFESQDFKQNTKQSGRVQDITGLINVFRKRDRMGLKLPSLKLMQCCSSNEGGLDNLENAVIGMGVNYTEMS